MADQKSYGLGGFSEVVSQDEALEHAVLEVRRVLLEHLAELRGPVAAASVPRRR